MKSPSVRAEAQVRGAQFSEAGVIFVDKPNGQTSATVVAKVRRVLRDSGAVSKKTKVGHGGTLDPMATGMLILLLGRATRLADLALHSDKTYSGTIQLGFSTDTDDITGRRISEVCPVPELTEQILASLSKRFSGTIRQRPPAFSALKIQGERAYDLARAGQTVELAEREVTIHRCELKSQGTDTITFVIHSSGGTYIRSIARDIGEALGCGATLAELRRERSGAFDLSLADRWVESESGLPHAVTIHPWWVLFPVAVRIEVSALVSEALAGGDQRVLSRLAAGPNAPGELVLYCVNQVPHGVVRGTVTGLELALHVGHPAGIACTAGEERNDGAHGDGH